METPTDNPADLISSQPLEERIKYHIRYSLAKDWSDLSRDDMFHAVSLAVKDIAVERMLQSEKRYREKDAKRVYYLSMEFLVGRTLENNLLNLGVLEACRQAVKNLGWNLDELTSEEAEPALGNGGLGRLAACFLDSLATLGIPGFGYGINYEFGLFKQVIENGYQKEKPDRWQSDGMYWQITRPEKATDIPVYGRVIEGQDQHGQTKSRWVDFKIIQGVPHDMPIIGYGGKTVNFLRLYSAKTPEDFHISVFNQGDYFKAFEDKITSETVSKALYPPDTGPAGKELRLLQEYFFSTCALRDIIRRYLRHHHTFDDFTAKVAIQMNDTHPAIAVADLMHQLVDDHGIPWERAWDITTAVLGYTNHTLMPEALERWPLSLFERLLPRHLQIIYRINEEFLKKVTTQWPGDIDRMNRMSVIEEGMPKHVRMAHLATVGSHSVNGVAALHSELLKKNLLSDFYNVWPERFNNKTNGVTPRRWIAKCNPGLYGLLNRTIGTDWVTNLGELKKLEPYAEDRAFIGNFSNIKKANKERLVKFIRDVTGFYVIPDSLFDIHAKRMHLYKRQLLNVLRIIHMYLKLVDDRQTPLAPQTFIFAGKAAPGYWTAKQVIKLINSVGQVINHDPRARDWMSVVFIPDYKVTVAELLVPAADLSEQISTAGMEASGTGNMKFAMNGALTIGTMDGANIEIREQVGPENIFIFGLKSEEIQEMRTKHAYDPASIVAKNPYIGRVIESLRSNRFCPQEPGIFNELVQVLMDSNDPFVHLADLDSYINVHEEALKLYRKPDLWMTKAILNVARMGVFSSDRTVQEYARDIWNAQPCLE